MHCFVGNPFRCKSAINYKIWSRFHKAISIQLQTWKCAVFWATLYTDHNLSLRTHVTKTVLYTSLSPSGHVTDAGCRSMRCQLASQPICNDHFSRYSTPQLPSGSPLPHHRRSHQPALVASSRARQVQGGRADVQGSPRHCAALPEATRPCC